ncbi:Similar to Hmcn1: Hemicentin-1 (Mus musculus) [Cotesia congregata]|uniref:Platelet-derived growth factor receptor-like protein n=1 Tax=Cotesia congregata TaxID=51543 RepID=A0A8J2EKD9_COTCN|nr:Similar to Hmcn1: Hemicentin-1 (Mus musculus) [Cotesia congregata]
MDLRHLIILLLSSSFCLSDITIFPNFEEINLKEGDELELTCTSTDGGDIDFFYPKNVDDEIETSSVEIVQDPTSNPSNFTLRRRKTYFGDTGWYGCTEASKNYRKLNHMKISVTPDTYNEIFIKWVYVYVTSPTDVWISNNKFSVADSFVGGNAIFPCRPNSPTASATLLFENSIKALPLDDRLSFDPKVGFILHNVSKNDSGSYTCYVKNFPDDWIIIKLNVLGPNALTPVMINSYSLQQMTLGQGFSMNCSIFYGDDFAPNMLHESYLKLSNRISNNYRVIAGNNIDWTIDVEAYPIPKFQWFDPKGNEIKNGWILNDFQVNGEHFSVQLIKPFLTYEDRGTYTLKATNAAEFKEIKLTLDVLVEPTIVQKSEDAEAISASYNQTITAECEAQGNPLPAIIWKYSHKFENSTESTGEGDLFNITSITVDGEKTISTINVKAQNTGKLICSACNEVNCRSAVVKVITVPVLMKLQPGPRPISDYQVVSLSEGETLHIFCPSTKNVTFFHLWLKRGVVNSNYSISGQEVGSKNAWYERKSVVYGDSGWYACGNVPEKYQDYGEFTFVSSPVLYKESNSDWLYVFVESSENLFVETPYINKDSDDNYILEVNVGNDLIFPCRPTSPDYQVDLYIDDQKANLSDHLLYDPKIGFTMLNITWEMPFFIHCKINDPTTGKVQRRDFSVNLENSTNGLDSPKIMTETLTHMVVGKPFTLQCKAYFNRVKTNYYFKWNKPQLNHQITQKLYQLNGTERTIIENWAPQVGFVIFELTIENVTPGDFGEYECVIYEYSSFKSDKIYLAPHERNQLELTSRTTEITVEIGNDWSLEFDVSAYPLPNFKWYDPKGRERENQWTPRNYEINGESFEVVLETKNTMKPEITKPKYDYIGNYFLNQKIEFQCQASGYPIPNLNWVYGNNYFNSTGSLDSEIFENGATVVTGKTIVTSTITIKMVESGSIRCNACNKEGCNQYIVQIVNVFDPNVACPKLETPDTPVAPCKEVHTDRSIESNQLNVYGLIMTSQQVNASKGGSVSIKCGFLDNKFRNNISWEKTNGSLAFNGRVAIDYNNDVKTHLYVSELTITNVDKSDEGYYICKGTTKDGSAVQNEYKLHVNGNYW